ncbi:MAG: FlgD immunoglobulin-like domain containing protein [Bacteroidota bacterium]
MRLASLLVLVTLVALPASAQNLVGLTNCCPNEVVTVSAEGDTTTVAAIGTGADLFIATVGSLVIDSDGGRGFFVRNGRIVVVDLATGAVTEQADAGEFVQLAGFDSGRDRLYALATRRDTLATASDIRFRNFLVAYDPVAQDTTHLVQVGEYTILDGLPQGGDTFATVSGPAVASANALHTIRNGRIVEVDLTTGTVTEGTELLGLPEVSGADETWLYRTEREVTQDGARQVYTGRLLRQPLAGGPDAPADTVGVIGRATIDSNSGGVEGDVFLASFGAAFYDRAGDRVLFNRSGRLVEVSLGTTQARDLAPVGRIRYVPGPQASAVVAVGSGPETVSVSLGIAPNPSAGLVGLALTLQESAEAEVAIFDALGRRVTTLHTGPLPAGTHAFAWDGDAAPGVYVVRAMAGGETTAVPLTLAR